MCLGWKAVIFEVGICKVGGLVCHYRYNGMVEDATWCMLFSDCNHVKNRKISDAIGFDWVRLAYFEC